MPEQLNFGAHEEGTVRLLKDLAATVAVVTKELVDLKKSAVTFNIEGEKISAVLKGWNAAGQEVTATVSKLDKEVAKVSVVVAENTKKTKDNTAALNDQKKAQEELINVAQQRVEAEKVRRSISQGLSQKDVFATDASRPEILNLQRARSNLIEYVQATRVSAKQINKIWRDVAADNIRAATGENRKRQELVNKVIIAQRQLGDSAKKAMSQTSDATKTATKSVQEFTLSWKSIRRIIEIQILRRLVFGLSNVLRQATVQAKEFSKAVAEIQTISQNAKLTTQEWESGLTQLSNAFGLDILDVAEAAYQTLSNQVAEGAETFKFLESAIRFGITTQTSATESVQLLTSAINAYGKDTDEVEAIAATFFKTIELGRIRGSELGNTFGRIAILGSQLGIELEELQASLTVLTRRGVKTSEVLTQIRGFLLKLIKPTGEMKKLFEDLGVESGEAAIEAFGFSGFLKILEARTAGSSTELAKFVSRIRGLISAIGLTGEGLKSFRKDLDEIKNATESYETAAELAFNNVGRTADKIFQEITNTLRDEFGKEILKLIVAINENFVTFHILIKSVGKTLIVFAGSTILVKVLRGLAAYIVSIRTATTATIVFGAKAKTAGVLFGAAFGGIVTAAVVAQGAIEAMIRDWIAVQDRVHKETEEFHDRTVKAIEAQTQKALKFFDDVAQSIQDEYAIVAAEVAEITGVLDKEYKIQAALSKKAAEAFKAAYTESEKVITDVLKRINDEQKTAISDIEKLTKFVKSFRDSVEQTLFSRKLELAPNVDEQFSLIETRISVLRERLNNAFKTGNIDLVQELFRSIAGLKGELASLDREAIDKGGEIRKKLLDNNLKAARKIEEFQDKIKEAFRKRDRKALNTLGSQRIKDIKEARDAEIELNKELEKVQSKRLGKYFSSFSKDLNALVKEAEDKGKQMQANLLEEVLKLEQKKLATQLRNDRIRANVAELRAEKPDEDFFKKNAEEINKLFTERIKLVQKTAAELRSFGQETAASKLEAQVTSEREEVIIKLIAKDEKDRLKRVGELVKLNLEIIDGLKMQGDEARKNLELAILEGTKLAESGALLADIERAKRRLIRLDKQGGISFGVLDATDAKILTQTVNTLNDDFKVFLDNGERSKEVGEGIRKTRVLFELFGAKLSSTAKDQLRLIEQQIAGTSELRGSVADILAKEKEQQSILKTLKITHKDTSDSAANDNKRELQTIVDLQGAYAQLSQALIDRPAVRIPEPVVPDTYARGGMVSSFDRVPSLLSPGEFVVNAKSARKFHSQLVGINSGMARGGSVSTTTVGDVHIHGFQQSGSPDTDVVRLGKRLRRQIRRGMVKLS